MPKKKSLGRNKKKIQKMTPTDLTTIIISGLIMFGILYYCEKIFKKHIAPKIDKMFNKK